MEEDGNRERPIRLGTENLSCYPKAKVKTTQPGFFFSFLIIFMLFLFSNNKKKK